MTAPRGSTVLWFSDQQPPPRPWTRAEYERKHAAHLAATQPSRPALPPLLPQGHAHVAKEGSGEV